MVLNRPLVVVTRACGRRPSSASLGLRRARPGAPAGVRRTMSVAAVPRPGRAAGGSGRCRPRASRCRCSCPRVGAAVIVSAPAGVHDRADRQAAAPLSATNALWPGSLTCSAPESATDRTRWPATAAGCRTGACPDRRGCRRRRCRRPGAEAAGAGAGAVSRWAWGWVSAAEERAAGERRDLGQAERAVIHRHLVDVAREARVLEAPRGRRIADREVVRRQAVGDQARDAPRHRPRSGRGTAAWTRRRTCRRSGARLRPTSCPGRVRRRRRQRRSRCRTGCRAGRGRPGIERVRRVRALELPAWETTDCTGPGPSVSAPTRPGVTSAGEGVVRADAERVAGVAEAERAAEPAVRDPSGEPCGTASRPCRSCRCRSRPGGSARPARSRPGRGRAWRRRRRASGGTS